MKETLKDQRNLNGVFRGKCEEQARLARRIILAQDSTHRSDSTRVANLEALRGDCVEQYKDLDRRTVKKSALPWYVLVGVVLGWFLSRQ